MVQGDDGNQAKGALRHFTPSFMPLISPISEISALDKNCNSCVEKRVVLFKRTHALHTKRKTLH